MHQGLLMMAFYCSCAVWYIINDILIVVTMLLTVIILYV